MVNSDKLKGRIREQRKTQRDCAVYIGVKTPTFNQKINNIRPFSLTEAEKLAAYLEISNTEFPDYFFRLFLFYGGERARLKKKCRTTCSHPAF